eukprot:m.358368 g.358368  ORF g.358368 m.358368 type:complete len:74 (+) comp103341_c0_seq1:104-325(+)
MFLMMVKMFHLVFFGLAGTLVSGASNYTIQELSVPGRNDSWHVSVNGNQYYFYGEKAFHINKAQEYGWISSLV